MFYTSRPGGGFDAGLRDALRQSRELLGEIAARAAELAELAVEARAIARHHGISYPPELGSLQAWLDASGYADRLSLEPWERAGWERSLRDLDPIDLLSRLAEAAAGHKPAPQMPHEAHATTPKAGPVFEWVRALDARFRLYFHPSGGLPLGLTLSDADLARVGYAVLDVEVSRESVTKARATAPEPLPSDCVIFCRDPEG